MQAFRRESLGLPGSFVESQLDQPLQHSVQADRERLLLVLERHVEDDARLRVPGQGVRQSLRGVASNQMIPRVHRGGSGAIFCHVTSMRLRICSRRANQVAFVLDSSGSTSCLAVCLAFL